MHAEISFDTPWRGHPLHVVSAFVENLQAGMASKRLPRDGWERLQFDVPVGRSAPQPMGM